MSARRTSLYDTHAAAGARFTEFAGWDMPVTYPTGTVAEHLHTRQHASLFDTSHMGRFRIHGPGAVAALGALITTDIATIPAGMSAYALLCRDDGGVIDDTFAYRVGDDEVLLVVNASRRDRDREHLQSLLPSTVSLEDVTDTSAMIALQGPMAHAVMRAWAGREVAALPRFGYRELTIAERAHASVRPNTAVSRTGYTGEDGFEIFTAASVAPEVWQRLIEVGLQVGVDVRPAGLGARDTLRLEAGFALYGHELTEEVSPAEARLMWACSREHTFPGSEAITQRSASSEGPRLVRLTLSERGVPREGYRVLAADGRDVGVVASGGRAPSLDRFIANAWVDAAVARDKEFLIAIRGRHVAAVRRRGAWYQSGYRTIQPPRALLRDATAFQRRHIGIDEEDRAGMLATIGAASLDALVASAVPAHIARRAPLSLPEPLGEHEAIARLRGYAAQNREVRSLIGLGYHASITPPVIQRNILENPRWYTQYTPYQAEISQGRLEALLTFQTMVAELTAMDIANASMLDTATACAEAVTMAVRAQGAGDRRRVLVDFGVDAPVVELLRSRLDVVGLSVEFRPRSDWTFDGNVVAAVLQYPETDGRIVPIDQAIEAVHASGGRAIVVTDLLACTLITPPGEAGADIVVGTTQRFGLPMWNGGPHAAFLATRDELKRLMPGRLVGVSRDRSGARALRLALQTREQHIRRDRATSNICTAQVLLAITAAMYAVYHGPEGLTSLARRIRLLAWALRDQLAEAGFEVVTGELFDTVTFRATSAPAEEFIARALRAGFALRRDGDSISIALDERSTIEEVASILGALGVARESGPLKDVLAQAAMRAPARPAAALERQSTFLAEEVFHAVRSETELLRYITSLQNRDLSLADAMIPLGSCTMKLNPTAAMVAISWPEFADVHPYGPDGYAEGYRSIAEELSTWLCRITEFAGCTLQPNSGAQGEYTGLLMIRAYHRSRGEAHRVVCLVPESAHGTNPASAVMAGMEVVVIPSAPDGSIDLEQLEYHAREAGERLAALMITYPSTHGVFETGVTDATACVHRYGGLVYMDGANMNAQVGLTSPRAIGADVCHLNLHKTFAIPHGGGGPGVGPVLCTEDLVPFLPGRLGESGPTGMVSQAPLGSAGILAISWAYVAMLGADGLSQATRHAILAANYIASRLSPRIPVVYTGHEGRVAHECILDFRAVERETGVTVEDVAKRLTDYGFHAPTMSWPVHGTLMVEPTESESRREIDRFCDAMLAIMDEIDEIRRGEIAVGDSPLRYAPHTIADVSGEWGRAYPRERGGYPASWSRERTYWPSVGRVDNVHGDRHLVCTCAPVAAYASTTAASSVSPTAAAAAAAAPPTARVTLGEGARAG